MPIALKQPETLVLSQARIEAFSVDVRSSTVTIDYSRGSEVEGEWKPVSRHSMTVKQAEVPSDLYAEVKTYLYLLLGEEV